MHCVRNVGKRSYACNVFGNFPPSGSGLENLKSCRTFFNVDRFSKWYQRQFQPSFPKPPYKHVCQIGDPVLRNRTEEVPVEDICTPFIQKIITQLWEVHERFNSIGLAAPQIGVPLSIVVIEMTPNYIKKFKLKPPMNVPIPPRVIINPTVKVLDYEKIIMSEQCTSLTSLTADVARYSRVKVQGWDEKGEEQSWEAGGYEARVIQHEFDHLHGVLFTDRMEPKSLACAIWQDINYHRGMVEIRYHPRKKGLKEKLFKQ